MHGRGSPADVCTEAQRVTDPGSCHRGGDLGTACPQPVSPDEDTGLTVQRADLTKHWACHLASLSLSVPKSKAKGLHQVISRESYWHYFILWRPVIKTCHFFLPLKRSVDTMALGGGVSDLRVPTPSRLTCLSGALVLSLLLDLPAPSRPQGLPADRSGGPDIFPWGRIDAWEQFWGLYGSLISFLPLFFHSATHP